MIFISDPFSANYSQIHHAPTLVIAYSTKLQITTQCVE